MPAMSSPAAGNSVRLEGTPPSDGGRDDRSSVTLSEAEPMEWPSGFPSRFATPRENPLEEVEFLRTNRERYLRNTQYNSTPAGQFRDAVNTLLQTWGINTLYTPPLYLDRAEIHVRHHWAHLWQNSWGDRPHDHHRWRHELPFFLHAPLGPLANDWVHCEKMRRDKSRPYMVFFQHMMELFTEQVMDLLTEAWATGSDELLYRALFTSPMSPTAYNTVKTLWVSRGIWNDTWGLWPGFHWNHEIPIDDILANDPLYQRYCRDAERIRAEQQNQAGSPTPNGDDDIPEAGTGVTEPQPSPVPETPPTPQLTRVSASLPSGRESSIPIPSVEAVNDEDGANPDVSSALALPPTNIENDSVIDSNAPVGPLTDEEMPSSTCKSLASADLRQDPTPYTREGSERRRQPKPPGPCKSGRISRFRPTGCCTHQGSNVDRCAGRNRWQRYRSHPL